MRKVDPSLLWLVAIKDKELLGEPYIAFAVVEAPTADFAIKCAEPAIEVLREAGRCRCHAVVIGPDTALSFRLNFFYKTSRLNPPAAQHEIECLKAEIERLRAEKHTVGADDHRSMP